MILSESYKHDTNYEVRVRCHDLMRNILHISDGTPCFLAGGSILGLYRGTDLLYAKDFDIYCYTKDVWWHLVNQFASIGKEYETENASTFKMTHVGPSIQFIKKRIGLPQDILLTFDLSVCAVAYDHYKNKMIYHPYFKADMNDRSLRMCNNQRLSDMSLPRITKYSLKGYTPLFTEKQACENCCNRLHCLTTGVQKCILKPNS